jgi:hypothetical protein
MSDDWASIRRQLGADYRYGPGHWFCVRHEDARREDGYPFSRKTGGSGRRVVLATRYGPNATLFARSASTPSAFSHPAHAHGSGSGSCQLDQDGWINFRIRVVVHSDALSDDTYSCEEPDGSPLLPEMERAMRL